MTIGRYESRRDEPFFWWGTPHGPERTPSIEEFVANRSIDRATAAATLVLLRRGISLFVISEASGAGKSTILHSLLTGAASPREPIYLRGGYESFDFLADREPESSILLVNEISPHLPAYLWGRPVRQLFQAMSTGYQAAGTAHAAGPAKFLHLMSAPPLEVPVDLVMRSMAILQLPEAVLTTVRPGDSPGVAVTESLSEASIDETVDAADRLLASAGLDRTGLAAELGAFRDSL